MRHTPRRPADRGFIMVAVLVGMAIAAIWMTAALPSWRQQVQRTREEDLIFRGEQYARAIVLFQNKNRNANPQDIDILVSQHFLRKKWKDPVTNCDFLLVGVGTVMNSPCPKYDILTKPSAAFSNAPAAAPISTSGNQQPGITGVRSRSTATSIKVYQQQQQYSLWQFDAQLYRAAHGMQIQQQGNQPGRGGPTGRDGGPGGAQGGAPGRGGGGPGGVGPGRGGGAPPPPPPPTARTGRGGM